MPIVVQRPTGVGASNQWAGIGSDVVNAVQGDDGDSTYIRQSFGLHTQNYVMPDLPASAATINSVSENARVRKFQNVGDNTVELIYEGSLFSGGSNTPLAWSTLSANWGPTTVAAVNAAVSGIRGFDTAGGENRCTELYRTVNYNDGAELIVILFNLLLPVVGAGLTLAQLSTFNAQVARPIGHYLRSDELAQAHREWVANPRPAFCFMEGGSR